MNEFLLRALVLFGTGAIGWFISLKYRIHRYGAQPIDAREGLIFVAMIIVGGAIGLAIQPIVGWILDQGAPVTPRIYEFFDHYNSWFIQIPVFVVVNDFLSYWAHRFLHSRYMWRFHAFHHSPKHLNWLSGMRASPVHMVVTNLPLTFTALLVLINGSMGQAIFLVFGDAIVQNLLHTCLEVPYASTLEKVIVTPRCHFVHHHPNPVYTNTNYGFMFSFWDKMFGTFTAPDQVAESEKGQLGLDYEQGLIPIYLGIPFKRRNLTQ